MAVSCYKLCGLVFVFVMRPFTLPCSFTFSLVGVSLVEELVLFPCHCKWRGTLVWAVYLMGASLVAPLVNGLHSLCGLDLSLKCPSLPWKSLYFPFLSSLGDGSALLVLPLCPFAQGAGEPVLLGKTSWFSFVFSFFSELFLALVLSALSLLTEARF